MESLAPVLVDELELLVDVMPDDTQVVVVDPERVRSRAHDLVATSEEFLGASWAAAAGGGTAPIDLGAASYRELDDVARPHPRARPALVDGQPVRPRRGARWRAVTAPGVGARRRSTATAATSSAPSPTSAAGSPTATASSCVHPGHGPAQRMVEVLGEHDVAARLVEPDDDDRRSSPASSRSPPPPSPTGSSPTASAWCCSPATTCPASAAPPATRAGCRRVASGRSTRSS